MQPVFQTHLLVWFTVKVSSLLNAFHILDPIMFINKLLCGSKNQANANMQHSHLAGQAEKVVKIPICSNSHFQSTLLVFCFGVRFPFVRIPILSRTYCSSPDRGATKDFLIGRIENRVI